mgnify:CR=1 FL=1
MLFILPALLVLGLGIAVGRLARLGHQMAVDAAMQAGADRMPAGAAHDIA